MLAREGAIMVDHTGLPAQLQRYWLMGEGAAKIGWGTPGDFDRCVTAIETAITKGGQAPLTPRVIKGLCATLHVKATGARPGHAPAEQAAHEITKG